MKKCENCGKKVVATGDIIVLADGYEIEEFKCKKCKITSNWKENVQLKMQKQPSCYTVVKNYYLLTLTIVP